MNGRKWNSVLFDYGEVFCRPQDESCIEKMLTLVGSGREAFFEAYYGERHDYDQGLVDGPGYWRIVSERLEIGLDDERIGQLVSLDTESWAGVDREMVDLALDLKRNGFEIAVLSNMPMDHAEDYRARHEWWKVFDHLFLSAEFELIKPMPEVYEHALEKMKRKGEEVLFVDDREVNLSSARKAGMDTYHYTARKAPKDLREFVGL